MMRRHEQCLKLTLECFTTDCTLLALASLCAHTHHVLRCSSSYDSVASGYVLLIVGPDKLIILTTHRIHVKPHNCTHFPL